jgi:hemerythrin-like domain-containing protein
MLAEIIESMDNIDDEPVKNKIINNLSEETRKKMQLHNRSFDESGNKEELLNNFITIINRVLNFR